MSDFSIPSGWERLHGEDGAYPVLVDTIIRAGDTMPGGTDPAHLHAITRHDRLIMARRMRVLAGGRYASPLEVVGTTLTEVARGMMRRSSISSERLILSARIKDTDGAGELRLTVSDDTNPAVSATIRNTVAGTWERIDNVGAELDISGLTAGAPLWWTLSLAASGAVLGALESFVVLEADLTETDLPA